MDLKEMIEFAEELGERFPDMTNSEIISACEEFAGHPINGFFMHETVLITAYERDAEIALQEARKYNML